MNESILLVEDELALRTTLSDRLRSEGYVVEAAVDGFEGFDKASNKPFDLVILDIMLPRRSGLDVCRDLRTAGIATPILILTVRNETVDKVVGLKLGADDYLTKPFESIELLARIEVLLRRAPTHSGHGLFQFGPVCIDLRRGEITRHQHPVYLTAREFQLLRYLIERVGSTVPRDELLRSVWGYGATVYTRTVDTHVFSLRQKLEENPKNPELILTVPGVGYKFVGSEKR
jgi:two-component system alkaline phosphatase synthesis response regulator PhoP